MFRQREDAYCAFHLRVFLTYRTVEILKYLGFVVKLDLVSRAKFVTQVHSGVEQLVVVVVLDDVGRVQDLVQVGRVSDETAGV